MVPLYGGETDRGDPVLGLDILQCPSILLDGCETDLLALLLHKFDGPTILADSGQTDCFISLSLLDMLQSQTPLPDGGETDLGGLNLDMPENLAISLDGS